METDPNPGTALMSPSGHIFPHGNRYETLARIGRGGMAEVMLTATRANGVVKLSVLKCLWPELAEDADFREMFLDEARLSARLSHPNVVQTHEVVEHEGRLAIAMEYLDGQPLTSVLTRLGDAPDFGLPTRLRIITKVLAGLEYAHGLTDFDGTPLELVHRDVSPHNVMVTYDGHVKLLDFGVAKTLAANHQTRPGGVKGKLAYLSPEAIRGDRVDRRADLFSVGVMLWETLAGRRLWARGNECGQAWRRAAGEPAPALPAELDVPVALRAICARALALDPAERFQTAAELGSALEGVGVDASDSHARHLGTLVADAFADERAQRRALIEFHLRPASSTERGATFDYDMFEVSLLGATGLHERRGDEIVAAPEASSDSTYASDAAYSIEVTPAADETPVLMTPSAPLRRRVGATLVAAAALAAVALVAGAYLEHRTSAWPLPASPPVSAPVAAAPALPPAAVEAPPAAAPIAPVPAPVAATTVEAARENRDPAIHEHREHHAHRARTLDLLSDEVLDLDGEPLATSTRSSSSM